MSTQSAPIRGGAAAVIDTHTHYVPPAYRNALLAQARRDPGFATVHRLRLRSTGDDDDAANSAARAEAMAAAGVDHSLLSLPPPALMFGSAASAAELAAAVNDELVAAAVAAPGKLSVLISLPLPHVAPSVAELHRVAGHPLVRGVQVLTTGERPALAPDAMTTVLAAVAETGLPVVLHPAVEPLAEVFGDWMLEASLAPVMSSTVCLARLVLSGTLDRIPDLRLVVPHLGGFLPYVLARVADFGRGDAARPLQDYLRERVWLDTCSYHPPAMRCAVDTVGHDRLILGSDHPFRGPQQRAVADVRAFFADDPPVARAVLGGTAAAVFGLTLDDLH